MFVSCHLYAFVRATEEFNRERIIVSAIYEAVIMSFIFGKLIACVLGLVIMNNRICRNLDFNYLRRDTLVLVSVNKARI
jgi:hypothetical protein